MEIVAEFILGGSKITADGDCSHGIKRCLLLGRKAETNLESLGRKAIPKLLILWLQSPSPSLIFYIYLGYY